MFNSILVLNKHKTNIIPEEYGIVTQRNNPYYSFI